ncbi:MAG: methyl-accepting chemotaxis protein [Clostridia bacterium]|nr:methyl-accepting chemotaxis protein [Clostridia bacterium]
MGWYYNMKISAKLLLGFIVVALIAGVIGLIGITNMKTIDEDYTKLYEENTVSLGYMGDVGVAFQRIRINIRDLIEDTANKEKYLSKIEELSNKINDNLVKYEKLISSEAEAKEFDGMELSLSKYMELKEKVIGDVQSNRAEQALMLLRGEMFQAAQKVDASINEIYEMNLKQAAERSEANSATANQSMVIMIIALVIGMGAAVGLGIFISRIISKPVKKLSEAADKIALGDVNVNVESTSKDEIGDLMKSFSKMVDNIRDQAANAEKIAAGDLGVEVKAKSENDVLAKSMKYVVETLRNLAAETSMLTKAAVDGKLDTRGNPDKFRGGYREIVEGVNKTLDAVIGPLNVAAEYVDRISKGDIPAKITDTYYGDFNEIKNNINMCIDAINELIQDANMLAGAAVEGKLRTRADICKHGGDFAKIIQGVNNTLDAVIEPVQEAASVLDEMSKGNLKVNVKGNYKGDHAAIKNALNDTIHTLSGYVTEISQVLNKMAEGNLHVSVNGEYKGDFIEIKNSLNLIIDSLNEVLGDINGAAEQVAGGARQVSDSSQALSQGSTEQASSVEEITASMEQVASQTKQNAVNANQANDLAASAKENALQGNSQMQEMLKAMVEINESSANISKIIKVIDEIAFQTNILALNAAVEAARAGQHGKGFAVVAEEVRNLAARSANAAKETTMLIEGSIKKVETGTKIANETARALDQIVDGVAKAADLVGQIASASNEQASGIAQVNQAIAQVSQVTQTNSATSEESAAASEELSGQAELLKQMVGRFSIKKASSYENINPDLIKMLESVADTKAAALSKKRKPEALPAAKRTKIALDDKDFGKY